jgi:hypothetical protein
VTWPRSSPRTVSSSWPVCAAVSAGRGAEPRGLFAREHPLARSSTRLVQRNTALAVWIRDRPMQALRLTRRPYNDFPPPHRPSRALAEPLRRARHRLHSPRMPRSRHRDQRTASPTSAAQIPRVLQHHPPASISQQPQPPAAGSPNTAGRAHRYDPTGRRTSSPLSARCLSAAAVSGRLQRYYEMAAALLSFGARRSS